MPLNACRQRPAFSLTELLVALALFGVVAAAVASTLLRQTRSARAATDLTELRDQLRDGAAILASDLRGISASGGDIYPGGMGSSSIEIKSTYGTSVACAISAGVTLALPPNLPVTSGVRLTHIHKRVDPGHGVFVFDEGPTSDTADDSWLFRTITLVSVTSNACGGSPLVSAADALWPGYRLTLNSPLPSTVSEGAALRFVERVRYALYRSGDGKWYLGYCASNTMAVPCAALQPLSGPYSPADTNPLSGTGGLNIYYYAADGAPTVNSFDVASVELALRGASRSTHTLAGSVAPAQRLDTVRTRVELRNR